MNKVFKNLKLSLRACIAGAAISALSSSPALAEDITLDADKQVEWHQNDNKIVAVGNAVAAKKDMSIRADKLTGFYDKKNNKTNINKILAEGNVVMKSAQTEAFGDSMNYNLKEDFAVLKGSPAKIKTDKETITATDAITYYPSREKAIAAGDVVVTNKDNKLYSNRLISFFKKDGSGNMEIEKVEIYDNVKIISPNANVTAARGIYFPKTGIVKLFDNVTIEQNGNFVKGGLAESNLNTGVSKLLSNPSTGGRVSGVFKEKSKDEKEGR